MGDEAIMYEGLPILRATNELIQTVNAFSEKERYFEEKFPEQSDLINMRVRENIRGLKRSAAVIKYYYGMNQYSKRDKEINRKAKIVECSRCSIEIED